MSLPDLRNFFSGPEDRIVLAPMEGVVDSITRDFITRVGGVDLCLTEFIRVLGQKIPDHVFYRYAPELLLAGVPSDQPARSRTASGTPMLVQLLGSDVGSLADNAAQAVRLGAAGIDLNFGCPAKTVNRHDGGATLLKDPRRIEAIVSAVRAAVPATHTVSAKVRLGFSDKELCREIACAAADGGASWLTVHARTRDEGYKPPAHWQYIGMMRESVRIPVIANGDVWTPADYLRMREVSGCRHAMLGRGLLGRPSLARECKALIARSAETKAVEAATGEFLAWPEMLPLVHEFFSASLAHRGPSFAWARLKQWLKSLSRTYPEAAALFEAVKRNTSQTTLEAEILPVPRCLSATETRGTELATP